MPSPLSAFAGEFPRLNQPLPPGLQNAELNHPTLVVEAEAEASVITFTARLRPRVHRLRPDLDPDDIVDVEPGLLGDAEE
jgi:hypothetical protein